MAVGVDLHLDAAIAEDALGHDRDHVHPLDLARDDEGRWLVVGIGGAGPDGGDEHRRVADHAPVPFPPAARERDDGTVPGERALQHHVRVDPDQLAVPVGVAVAGPGLTGPDVAHHRTGVAADAVVGGGGEGGAHQRTAPDPLTASC